MGKFGILCILIGIVLIGASTQVPPERGKTSVSSQATVGNPFLKGADSVSTVNQLQGYVFPLGALSSHGRVVGELLASIQQSTFYVQVALQGAGYLLEVQAKDYRNATQGSLNTASQIALAYAISLVLTTTPEVIAVQLILDVASSGTSWTVSDVAHLQLSDVSNVSNAFGVIRGFVADALWGLYHFVQQNLAQILLVFGILLFVVGVVASISRVFGA
jgi:hypothetical protein